MSGTREGVCAARRIGRPCRASSRATSPPTCPVAPVTTITAPVWAIATYSRGMINGTHVILYSRDADADRVFFRDVLSFASVDAAEGWLIFKTPPAEIAVHPTEGTEAHQLLLMCDDVAATVAELTAKGVAFTGPVVDRGWGLLTAIRLPGGGELGLYEPRHPTARDV